MIEAKVTKVKVIAAYQHAHTLAAGITTRHFRNGSELEPIIHDPYYDFFFQEIRPLRKEITIKQVQVKQLSYLMCIKLLQNIK